MRKRKCTGCKNRFPADTMHKFNAGYFHSFDCAVDYGKEKGKKLREKQEKKDHTKAKKALKDNDRSFQLKKAQQIFNKWVRLRDEGNDCISCGKPPKKKNAGHFKSRGGFPELRFEPLNCHLQCEHCNTHLSGNLSLYRISLITKIGIDKVEWIEGPHDAKKYTIEELKKIQELYKRKIKELTNATQD